MENLERAQNILRLVDKCQTPSDCKGCGINALCKPASKFLDDVELATYNIRDDVFAATVNRMDGKWKANL